MQDAITTLDAKPFRGWRVVAGAFAVTFVGFGSAYTFSAFLQPLQAQFGASRASVSLVFSVAGFLYFGLGLVSGPLADRWGARRLAVGGMVLVAAGLCLAAFAQTLHQVYLAYSVGIGVGVGVSYVPVVAAVQRWFVRKRAFASGIAVSGIGVGTLLLPPLATALIAQWGWRLAYGVLGLVALTGVGMAFLIEGSPRECGQEPDGEQQSPGQSDLQAQGTSLRAAVRTRDFALLYIACLICSFGVFVPFVHLVPYAVDHGVPKLSAAILVGAIGVGSTAGRFLLGGVADRFGRRRSLAGAFAGMGFALASWAMCATYWPLMAFALAYGVFYGSWVAILPAVVMDLYGGRHISSIIGALYTSVAVGTLAGPTAVGLAFDRSGSYTIPIVATALANLAAAVIVLVRSGAHRS